MKKSHSVSKTLLLSEFIGSVNPPAGVPTDTKAVIGTIKTVLTLAYAVAGVAAVIFIIYGGYRYIISAGDTDGVRKAQQTLIYAVAGLVIVIISSLVFNFIARLLGVEGLITVLNLPFHD